jgi:hypothetical protein
MKKHLTLSLVLLALSCTSLLAQKKKQPPPPPSPYQITWSQCFGGSAQDIGFSFCEFDTSEVLVASYTYSDDGSITTPVHGSADWWAEKFTHTTTPQLVWSYTYGGSMYDKLRQMTPSYNHKSYALFGTAHSKDGDIDKSQIPKGNDKDNWWLVKINNAGTILQQKLIVGAGNGDCGGRALLPTSDNGYILLGWSNAQAGDFNGNYSNFGAFSLDGWLFKLDSNLNIQWRNHYGGTGADAPIRIIRAGNYYYFTGLTTSNDFDMAGQNHPSLIDTSLIASADFGVWKTDTMGNVIWAKSPGGSGEEFPFDIHADWDGNIVCAGFTESTDGDVTGYHGGVKDGWLFKLNANDGSLMWEKTYGGSVSDAIKRILPMPDHGYTLLCTSSSKNGDAYGAGNHGSKDVWLLRVDSNRNLMYSKMFGGSDSEEALDLMEFPGQGYLILASTSSKDGDLQGIKNPTSGEDNWMFFVSDSSLFNSNSSQKFQPNVMQMAEAFNPTSVIVYPSVTSGPVTLQSEAPVNKGYTIRVVDISGKEVWSKVITTINAPVNQNIDLSKNPKGTYFVQIQFTDGKKQTQKVVVQ